MVDLNMYASNGRKRISFLFLSLFLVQFNPLGAKVYPVEDIKKPILNFESKRLIEKFKSSETYEWFGARYSIVEKKEETFQKIDKEKAESGSPYFAHKYLESKANEKGLVLFFSAQWCAPCKALKRGVLKTKEIKNSIHDNYVFMEVDIDSFDGVSLQNLFEVKYIPTIIIVDNLGNIISRKEKDYSKKSLSSFLEISRNKLSFLSSQDRKFEKEIRRVNLANKYTLVINEFQKEFRNRLYATNMNYFQ